MSSNIIGIDIGGVLIERGSDEEDTSFFGKNYLKTPAVKGAFDAMKALAELGFTLHLVSKCGKQIEEKSLNWLDHHRVYERTGLAKVNVHFCRKRQDKAEICSRLRTNYFVDDRLEVLSYLTMVPNLFLLNGQEKEIKQFAFALPRVKVVADWDEILQLAKNNELHRDVVG